MITFQYTISSLYKKKQQYTAQNCVLPLPQKRAGLRACVSPVISRFCFQRPYTVAHFCKCFMICDFCHQFWDLDFWIDKKKIRIYSLPTSVKINAKLTYPTEKVKIRHFFTCKKGQNASFFDLHLQKRSKHFTKVRLAILMLNSPQLCQNNENIYN